MVQVFMHNSDIQRGSCAGCKASATWTVVGTIPLVGTVKSDMCDACVIRLDILTWAKRAEGRILGEFEEIVRRASNGSTGPANG